MMRKGVLLATISLALTAAAAFAFGHASASNRRHVYTGRPGDTFRVPAAATRCTVATEVRAVELLCRHEPSPRYSVVYFSDGLYVYRNGKPDNPVFATKTP